MSNLLTFENIYFFVFNHVNTDLVKMSTVIIDESLL